MRVRALLIWARRRAEGPGRDPLPPALAPSGSGYGHEPGQLPADRGPRCLPDARQRLRKPVRARSEPLRAVGGR
jgi:hypothetical protein